ncbi:MAG TPA: VanZ family protein [Drouetiella sp.]|jgi:VanZ family protein
MIDKPAFRWLLVIAWMGVIFAFSNQAHSGEATEQLLHDWNVPVRKCAHMFEYAVLFWLSRWACLTIRRPSLTKPGLLAFLICLLYAASDEYHQSFVPGRSAQVQDVGVDMTGSLIAVFLARYFFVVRSFCSKTRS